MYAVKHGLYFGRKCRAIGFIYRVAHFAYLKKDIRKIRFHIITPALFKLGKHIAAPVGAFQFNAVCKKGSEVIIEGPDLSAEFFGKSIQIILNSRFLVMI